MRPSRSDSLFAWLFVSAVLPASAIYAETLVVDLNGDGDFTEIQPALDAAQDGDTVLVRAGEYVIREPLDLNRFHDLGDPVPPRILVVRSESGPEQTTIRMQDPIDPERASVVIFKSREDQETVLEGFTITGGTGTRSGEFNRLRGGGVFCESSSPLLRNLRIVANSAQAGGGFAGRLGASPLLENCVITGESSSGGIGHWGRCGAQELVSSVRELCCCRQRLRTCRRRFLLRVSVFASHRKHSN